MNSGDSGATGLTKIDVGSVRHATPTFLSRVIGCIFSTLGRWILEINKVWHWISRDGVLWWSISVIALLFVATLPITIAAQTVLSYSAFGILVLLYGVRLRLPKDSPYLPWLRWFLIFFSTFLGFRYLYWRATETLPFGFGLAASVAGLLLFLVEIYGFVTFLFGHFVNVQPLDRNLPPASATDSTLPTVDVFIPTYNEDPSVLRPTVIAATQMRYPKDRFQVWILDDGGTEQKLRDPDPAKARSAQERAQVLKDMAEEFGARYLSRARNLHAKAGNINHALQQARAELVLILDCDHIPTHDFLQRSVPYFLEDEKLFLLQTPHNFVTLDPVERNLRIYRTPAENELFYGVMQLGLDFWGTSFFCGSAAVLRREVLDRLGGISGQTITEDAETTLDALSLGYHTAYLNRPMVSGLQPETYSGLVIQRVRWGQGMLQIFLLKNPWLQPKLHFVQRLLYTNFTIYWGFAVSRLLLFLAPPAYLLAGLDLCDTTASQILAYAGPYYLASLVTTQFYYREVRWPFVSQVYETIQSIYVTQGILRVLWRPRSPSFQVTPKGERLDSHFVSALSRPFYLLLILNMASIAAGIWRWQINPWMHGAIAFVLFWSLMDLLFILTALGVLFEKPQRRSEPRAEMREPVWLKIGEREMAAEARDASRLGLGIEVRNEESGWNPRDVQSRCQIGVEVEIRFADGRVIPAEICYCQDLPDRGILRLGLSYRLRDLNDERHAVDWAFGDSDRLQETLERRHGGKSIVGAILYLGRIAMVQGLGHIGFLLRRWVFRILADEGTA